MLRPLQRLQARRHQIRLLVARRAALARATPLSGGSLMPRPRRLPRLLLCAVAVSAPATEQSAVRTARRLPRLSFGSTFARARRVCAGCLHRRRVAVAPPWHGPLLVQCAPRILRRRRGWWSVRAFCRRFNSPSLWPLARRPRFPPRRYGGTPASFRLGKGKVIPGWEAIVGGMSVGMKACANTLKYVHIIDIGV